VQVIALVLFSFGAITLISYSLSLTLTFWGAAFLCFMWDHHSDKKEKQIRKKAYISRFSPEELRANIYNPNLIYKVIAKNDPHLTVQIVWSGENAVKDAIEHKIELNSVHPFNMELFLNLT